MFYINNNLETDTRYDMVKFFDFNIDNLDCLTSFFITNIKSLSVAGTYTVQLEAGRPDLLSYYIYEDTQYWWILMWYNGLTALNEIVPGMTIDYPSLSSIEALYTRASINSKTVQVIK